MSTSLETRLKAEAAAAGFDDAAIASVAAFAAEHGRRLDQFVALGRHGDMDWLASTRERRRHPNVMWPAARSAVVLALSYAPEGDPLAALAERERGVVSCYARGRDYHDVVKGKLKRVAGWLARAAATPVKVFVDTAPLMEKPIAQTAGLGWQGKHTNIVSRTHGSWLFLGVILTAAELAPDTPEVDHCGSCRRCLDICPTAAFPAPYQLDARRCISYLTIEHAGHIDAELRPLMGNRIFGCDDCLAVCPWNKFAVAARETRFAATHGTDNPPLAELLALDDAAFRRRFAGTPVKRTGRDRFLRNVLIAAGNSGQPELAAAVVPLLGDASVLVRAMAVWALARLAAASVFDAARDRHAGTEPDAAVRAEWDRATQGDRVQRGPDEGRCPAAPPAWGGLRASPPTLYPAAAAGDDR